ncbi:MAG: universal stress protein [Rudaea sp.]
MRDILAVTDQCPTWQPNVVYAAHLAARLDASLTGLYVSPEPRQPPDGEPDVVAREIIEAGYERLHLAQHARADFIAWASRNGVEKTDWQIADRGMRSTIRRASNWHDVAVFAHPGEAPPWTVDMLGQIVLSVEIPCLFVPASVAAAKLHTIAIAWNGSPESVRALHASLPLLRLAGRIVILYGRRARPSSSPLWPPASSIEDYLSWQGLNASVVAIDVADGHTGAQILFEAGNIEADLLVMGGYGRTRFSERWFGGVTLHALHRAQMPVFMRH